MENLIISVIVSTKLECHRTAAEHVKEGLSRTTELAFTGMALPDGEVTVVGESVLTSIQGKL